MRAAAALLACCVVVLGAYFIADHSRTPKYRPVLVVANAENHSENEANILAACPGVALGFENNVERTTHYYNLVMFWKDNQWKSFLFQESSSQEYLLWTAVDQNYDRLLRDACDRLKDESRYAWPETSDVNRYDLHDLHNGNLLTAAILDRQTGRVWIWTSLTDNKGAKTGKSAFLEEKLVPNPDK
jgi:hypothetical protein